eukprot:GEZU01025219.1.p1 GENE.GEZU01025219.1~~GEZU01025219.1.p1  ORF type:complete len:926 (+),score=166.32 GEZU01025219.1:96-2780(+)
MSKAGTSDSVVGNNCNNNITSSTHKVGSWVDRRYRDLDDPSKLKKPFQWAPRMEYADINYDKVKELVIRQGTPVVLSNTLEHWGYQNDEQIFTLDWLRKHYGDMVIANGVRNNETLEDIYGYKLGEYIDYICQTKRKQLLYGKDVQSPEEWKTYIASKIHPYFMWKDKGDLLGEMPKDVEPETLMIYIGYENNRTPGHKDICGTLGHNIMVFADDGAGAVWFCAKRDDKEKVAKLWQKHKQSIDADNYFMPWEDLAEADFPIYLIEQRVGDLVLVPCEAAHQVLNVGGKSCKFAWNRLPPITLPCTLGSALLLYHEISKPEVYRCHLAAYKGLEKRTLEVEDKQNFDEKDEARLMQLFEDFPPLLTFVEKQIADEWIDFEAAKVVCAKNMAKRKAKSKLDITRVDTDRFKRLCDRCKCDMWNRYYHYTAQIVEKKSKKPASPKQQRMMAMSSGAINKDGTPVQPDDDNDDAEFDMCLACVAERRPMKKSKASGFQLCEYLSRKEIEQLLLRGFNAFADVLTALSKLGKTEGLNHNITFPAQGADGKFDIASVQARVRPTSPKQTTATVAFINMNMNVSCHSCHVRRPEELLVRCGAAHCTKNYCDRCLKRHFDIEVTKLQNKIKKSKQPWKCFYCTNTCKCPPCSRKRGDAGADATETPKKRKAPATKFSSAKKSRTRKAKQLDDTESEADADSGEEDSGDNENNNEYVPRPTRHRGRGLQARQTSSTNDDMKEEQDAHVESESAIGSTNVVAMNQCSKCGEQATRLIQGLCLTCIIPVEEMRKNEDSLDTILVSASDSSQANIPVHMDTTTPLQENSSSTTTKTRGATTSTGRKRPARNHTGPIMKSVEEEEYEDEENGYTPEKIIDKKIVSLFISFVHAMIDCTVTTTTSAL